MRGTKKRNGYLDHVGSSHLRCVCGCAEAKEGFQ